MTSRTLKNNPLKGKDARQILGMAACGSVLFSCLILNWQPWLYVGEPISQGIIQFPFVALFFKIPFGIGSLLELLLSNMGQFIGLSLWALIQYLQVLPIWRIANRLKVSERIWWYYGIAYLLEVLVCFIYSPPYFGGVEGFLADFMVWDWDLIDWPNAGWMLAAIGSFEVVTGLAIELNKK